MIDPPDTPEALRERWKSGIWKVALDAILEEAARTMRSISAKFLKSLDLPKFEGRLDLRGVSFYEPYNLTRTSEAKGSFLLSGEDYLDLDFSHAVMRFSLSDSKLFNINFSNTMLEYCEYSDCTVDRCDFKRAFMPWFQVNRGAIFKRSIFDYSKIRHYACIREYAHFEECSFLKLDWRMIHFRGCCFNNCNFTGHLQKSDAERTLSHGFDAIRDYLKKREYKGYNVFENCSFEKLTVSRFSVQGGALTLKHCVGFPTSTLPSKEGRNYLDYYSENVKPKNPQ
jgi:uncharacterized protein YjbI with pentapeptide repeats